MRRLRNREQVWDEPTANPMDGLGNLADAMLVLAVGIMLALIINWQVDINNVSAPAQTENEPVEIAEEDLQNSDSQIVDKNTLQQIGALYYDEEAGVYYAITED